MLNKLIEELKKDKDLYYCWQANIAMAIYDQLKPKMNKKKLHEACNVGAKKFLDLLLIRNKKRA